MIIYEVNLNIEENIFNDYLDWLKTHIKEMLSFDGFQSARLFRHAEEENQLVVHYEVTSKEDLNNYFENHAARMREDGINRFGNQFTATRRILNPI